MIFGHTRGQDPIQTVGLLVEHANLEVVEMEKLARAAQDLLLQKGQTLVRVQARELFGIQAEQLPAGLVDRVDLILEPSRAGDVPDDGRNLGDSAVPVHDRRRRHLETFVGLGGEAEAATVNLEGTAPRLRLGPRRRFDTALPHLLANRFRETEHQRIGPVEFAGLAYHADALADAVDDRRGLAGRVDAS